MGTQNFQAGTQLQGCCAPPYPRPLPTLGAPPMPSPGPAPAPPALLSWVLVPNSPAPLRPLAKAAGGAPTWDQKRGRPWGRRGPSLMANGLCIPPTLCTSPLTPTASPADAQTLVQGPCQACVPAPTPTCSVPNQPGAGGGGHRGWGWRWAPGGVGRTRCLWNGVKLVGLQEPRRCPRGGLNKPWNAVPQFTPSKCRDSDCLSGVTARLV